MTTNYPLKGACQCGQVTYSLRKAPSLVLACHCTECQKLSTSPFSVTAIVSSDSIDFNGEIKEWSRLAESGNTNTAVFCPNCGNRIYHFNPADSSNIKLKLKPVNLGDDSIFEPKAHIWTSQKQTWYTPPEGIEVRDKQ